MQVTTEANCTVHMCSLSVTLKYIVCTFMKHPLAPLFPQSDVDVKLKKRFRSMLKEDFLQKDKIFRTQKKTSLSGKFTTDINSPKGISEKRKVGQKEVFEQNEEIGLRMDFVDCKCKFGTYTFSHHICHPMSILKYHVTEWNSGSVELNVQD